MRPAGDKRHVLAGTGQETTEEASKRAAAHDGNPHGSTPLASKRHGARSGSSPWQVSFLLSDEPGGPLAYRGTCSTLRPARHLGHVHLTRWPTHLVTHWHSAATRRPVCASAHARQVSRLRPKRSARGRS